MTIWNEVREISSSNCTFGRVSTANLAIPQKQGGLADRAQNVVVIRFMEIIKTYKAIKAKKFHREKLGLADLGSGDHATPSSRGRQFKIVKAT